MTGPPEATAAVRVAVRRALADMPTAATVAAAVSGGADSLALAAALAFLRPGSRSFVVDHGLQPDSAQVARRAMEQCTGLGLRAEVLRRPDDTAGADCEQALDRSPSPGPEGAARRLRYALLTQAMARHDAQALLLGHTLDDQAETVLLGLARGSGARSLAGMPTVRAPYRRPLLRLRRATTAAACVEAGLTPWDDPQNADATFTRTRVRHVVLPTLECEAGPGIAAALARTADLLREDADALDELTPQLPEQPECAGLLALLPALRSRALTRWATPYAAGPLTSGHISSLRALVEAWHGQGAVALPGGARVRREAGRLVCSADG